VRLPRFRFSLATSLLVIAWSAVVLRLNTRPHESYQLDYDIEQLRHVTLLEIGWPWRHLHFLAIDGVAFYEPFVPDYWALAGDTVVGILFVALLTWGSAFFLRRAGRLLRFLGNYA